MTTRFADQIERLLASTPEPLTVKEMATALGIGADDVAEEVWSAPHRFSWQPGGRWTLAAAKAAVEDRASRETHDDTRGAVIAPRAGVELRAVRLSTGATLRVIAQPLDNPSFFTVRTEGSDLQLILNSAHEVFETVPMPFVDDTGTRFETLSELLLAAWAIHEAEAATGVKRELEDARFFWGRRLVELLKHPR